MTDLLPVLQEFYRDKLAAVLEHQACARHVSQSGVAVGVRVRADCSAASA